jgi:hypothetical protein
MEKGGDVLRSVSCDATGRRGRGEADDFNKRQIM